MSRDVNRVLIMFLERKRVNRIDIQARIDKLLSNDEITSFVLELHGRMLARQEYTTATSKIFISDGGLRDKAVKRILDDLCALLQAEKIEEREAGKR